MAGFKGFIDDDLRRCDDAKPVVALHFGKHGADDVRPEDDIVVGYADVAGAALAGQCGPDIARLRIGVGCESCTSSTFASAQTSAVSSVLP